MGDTVFTSRVLWIVNHVTLNQSEPAILRGLGMEVFVPKILAKNAHRSAAVSFEHDSGLGLSSRVLQDLNEFNFFEDTWPPPFRRLINRTFSLVVTAFFPVPLGEALRHFRGPVIARAFGQGAPWTYDRLLKDQTFAGVKTFIEEKGNQFFFGQAYSFLAEVEPSVIASRALTLRLSLPISFLTHKGSWTGGKGWALFLCPRIDDPYYRRWYLKIKAYFPGLPLRIMGGQARHFRDPSIVRSVSMDDVWRLYREASVFVYMSIEPRHLHYSPLEAMLVGVPVLFRRGSLLDRLSPDTSPASCDSYEEMNAKATRLIEGDAELSSKILETQDELLRLFSEESAVRDWYSFLKFSSDRGKKTFRLASDRRVPGGEVTP